VTPDCRRTRSGVTPEHASVSGVTWGEGVPDAATRTGLPHSPGPSRLHATRRRRHYTQRYAANTQQPRLRDNVTSRETIFSGRSLDNGGAASPGRHHVVGARRHFSRAPFSATLYRTRRRQQYWRWHISYRDQRWLDCDVSVRPPGADIRQTIIQNKRQRLFRRLLRSWAGLLPATCSSTVARNLALVYRCYTALSVLGCDAWKDVTHAFPAGSAASRQRRRTLAPASNSFTCRTRIRLSAF